MNKHSATVCVLPEVVMQLHSVLLWRKENMSQVICQENILESSHICYSHFSRTANTEW